MARTGVTYEQVETAVSQMLKSDISITVDELRNVLGTGSKTTLARHLRLWRDNQSVKNEVKSVESLPRELSASVGAVWQKLEEEAEARVLSHKEEVSGQIEDLNADLHQSRLRIESLLCDLGQKDESIDRLSLRCKKLEMQINEERDMRIKSIAKYDEVKIQLGQQNGVVERLQGLLDKVHDNHAHYEQSVLAQRERERSHAAQEREESRKLIDGYKRQHLDAAQTVARLESRCLYLEGLVEDKQVQHKEERENIKEANQQLQQAQSSLRSLVDKQLRLICAQGENLANHEEKNERLQLERQRLSNICMFLSRYTYSIGDRAD